MKMEFIVSFTILPFRELFEINRENERVMVEISRGTVINTASFLLLLSLAFAPDLGYGQEPMSIQSFVAVENNYDTRTDNLSFGFGEQDLLMTADLADKMSFLGETVFRYSSGFQIGVERIIVKYNYKGNHNILLGRRHTPLNYWNDIYHHGRLFFPTTSRPTTFTYHIIPIHTNGISLQGHNLGKMKFGYDVMLGNGLGSSSEMVDNDKNKSISTAIHVKPADGLRIGASIYKDKLASGAITRQGTAVRPIDQRIISAHVAYFSSSIEFLAETSMATNKDDSASANTMASYIYLGYKMDKLIPYIRYDYLDVGKEEMYYNNTDRYVFVAVLGVRYEVSYQAVVKVEFMYSEKETTGPSDVVNFQLAIGF